MTDLGKAAYLKKNVGERVSLFHILNGDLYLHVVSVNYRERTFKYTYGDSKRPFTMDFGEVIQFGFRDKGTPYALDKGIS